MNEFGKLLEIDTELKKLVLTGVLHCLTNTMGIETIEFTSPVRNVNNETKMLSPEGGTTWLTITPGRKSKSNSYLTVCKSKNQRTTDAHNIMVVSIIEFISGIPGQSEEYMTPVFQS